MDLWAPAAPPAEEEDRVMWWKAPVEVSKWTLS